MQTLHTINRRSVLAASAAALVAGTIPATADDERAEWLELWSTYEEEERRHVAATDALFGAEHAAERAYPEPAPCIWQWLDGAPRRYWHGGIRPVSRDDIENAASGPARAERLAALDAWENGCRAVDARFNVPALQAARDAQWERHEAAERAIIEKPATSLLGVAVKLALWARTELTSTLECAGGEDHEEGQQWLAGPAVAAWGDALRLAGLPARMGMERRIEG